MNTEIVSTNVEAVTQPLPLMQLVKNTYGLTRKQTLLVTLLMQGQTNAQIGAAIGVDEKAIKGSMTRIFAKFGVSSRMQVASAILQLAVPDVFGK